MHQKTKDIQRRFEGFLQTPCLWKSDDMYQLSQFDIEQKHIRFDRNIDSGLRLGKYVEQLVLYQLSKDERIQVIAENVQIAKNGITLGELDCLLYKDKQPVHLEIVYKFYVYDVHTGTEEPDYWIGPNRKDSLVEKLEKLRQQQLPLLYSDACSNYLQSLGLHPENMLQHIYFKAQLFVPPDTNDIPFSTINKDCIAGIYIHKDQRYQFKDAKFYIPAKKDWLVIPHTQVHWLTFEDFILESNRYLQREFSPLCWMKSGSGNLQKFFLVWW